MQRPAPAGRRDRVTSLASSAGQPLTVPRSLLRLILPLWIAACAPCGTKACGTKEVAELRARVGVVERSTAGDVAFVSAAVGARFGIGDGLRTGKAARAELALTPDGRLRVEADTLVRFADSPPGKTEGRLQVDTGAVEIETGAAELLVDAPGGGTAQLAKSSSVRVQRGKTGLALAVSVGRASIEHEGKQLEARPGETLTLEVGRAVIEPIDVAATEPPPSAEVAAVPTLAPEALPGDPPVIIETSIEPAELEVIGGESATVHDPRPPSIVGVVPVGCSGAAELDLRDSRGTPRKIRSRQKVPGAKLAIGLYRYSLRCLDAGSKPVSGTLRIVRDSGARRLPQSAPKAVLDADGRRYTVRYQHLLPELRVRWAAAPEREGAILELRGTGGDLLREPVKNGEVLLRSGRVREGDYRFMFVHEGARSPETALRIELDDSARTAQLTEPKAGAFTAGGQVRVAGAALLRSTVRVGERTLPLSKSGRFSAEMPAPGVGRALAVRVQHPMAGVHYYLRRAASAAR